MDKANRKMRRKEFAAEERAVRDILNEWEPIGFSTPEDEYDCLVHRVLSVLHGGGTKDELAAKIKFELEHHLGLKPFPAKKISPAVDWVWNWWQERTS